MLRLLDTTKYAVPLDEWPLPIEVPFVDSRELAWLRQDLDRYARGRVRGRSYLIAGHRGAGKTALVQRAADLLAAETMRESVKENGALPDGVFQRPLLVKLHGPSMLDPPEVRAAPGGKGGTADVGTDGDEEKPQPREAGKPADNASATPGPHAALVQITIGLYRALAAEVATGFRAHSRLAKPAHRGDAAELATQLSLDLDGGAAPARLRSYWRAAGRLTCGVLWPINADETLEAHGMGDQGLRELVALSTAAQAFQVCTGRISYSETSKDQLVRKEIAELKGESNLKDALSRLGTLGLGALTGVSLLGVAGGTGSITATSALAGGLAVWLLGSLSFSWSRGSTRTDDRTVDYSFIRDSTLATLGRDLPVVIDRVRQVGLAPVFVIDELDKVRDAPGELATLIGKLKHLIADFGFFCFLVNRDCFEEIEARIRDAAYPPEHTLFSDRLLLRPDPAFMLRYVTDLVGYDEGDPQAGLARTTFALIAVHDARLNLTELMRLLARASRGAQRELGSSEDLTSQRHLVIATVQIAIDETLRSSGLRERMDASASFAQLAIDTLYYPSRLWSSGVREVDPSPAALKEHLQVRRGTTAATSPTLEPSDDDASVSAGEIDILQTYLMALLTSLAHLPTLRTSLGDRNASGVTGEPQVGDTRLADIPPRDVEAIVTELADGRFRFRFSPSGDPFVAQPGRLDLARRAEAEQALAYATAFQKLMAAIGVDVDQLARTPLIASVGTESLARAVGAVSVALRRGSYDPDVEQHLSTLKRLQEEVAEHSAALGELLLTVRSLERDVDEPAPILPAISRLIRFDREPREWLRGHPNRPAHGLPPDAAGLERWTSEHLQWLLPAPGNVGLEAPPDYPWLAERLRRTLVQARREQAIVPDYTMLIQAVRGQLPAAALGWDLSRLTAGDWSRLALSAVPTRTRPASAPYWLFVAALRGLGFGREALADLSAPNIAEELTSTSFQWLLEMDGMTTDACLQTARGFAVGAPDRPPGLLVVETEGERYGADAPSVKRPTLIVDSSELAGYRPALNWLIANGILAGQTLGISDSTEYDS